MTKPPDSVEQDDFQGLSLLNCLERLEDPRLDRKKLYPLAEILLVALCALLSNCEGFRSFAIYGEEKLEFLRTIYPFHNGIPSHDTFARVFTLLCPKSFSCLLTQWTEGLREHLQGLCHSACDGKTLRGSRRTGQKQSAAHVVSAFCSETRLTLAQEKAPCKGYGENHALLEMLRYLRVQKSVITADAAACHVTIAEAIVAQKAHYVLALKRNQGNLYEAVESHFQSKALRDKANMTEDVDKGHGRLETRRCFATEDLRALQGLPEWPNLKSLICVESTREIQGKKTMARRYYLSSLGAEAQVLLKLIRSHWAIENSLHWVLDVTFCEDRCRARTKNAAENMALLRRLSANVLQKIKKPGESLKGLRIRAAANNKKLFSYLTKF